MKKTIVIKLVSNAVNCRNDAVKLAGIKHNDISSIFTQYTEPRFQKGMGFAEFLALPRNCTITFTMKEKIAS